jgi:uncharacterized membrane protein YkoI
MDYNMNVGGTDMKAFAFAILLVPMASQAYASDIGLDEAARLQNAGAIKRLNELNQTAAARHANASIYETELEYRGDRYLYQVELRKKAGEKWEMTLMQPMGSSWKTPWIVETVSV